MFLIRWFALDTVLVVLSIQLFLAKKLQFFNVSFIAGVCTATAFVYILDRYYDFVLYGVRTKRHNVYYARSKWVFLSLLLLGGLSFMFWLKYPMKIKISLLSYLFLCILHLYFLRFQFYSRFKDYTVMFIFTAVMLSFYMVDFKIILLVSTFTFLNLTLHQLIENRFSTKLFYEFTLIVLLLVMILIWNFGVGFYLLTWLIVMVSYYWLIFNASKLTYWYEFAELIFAMPFLLYLI
ncbi:MAG: hypothetical protein VXX85_01905 [Candidatus Margulisiibacteriota bacterium]|nr:hypothetical protein [Candidatus Margulisiibacteriota bacterium]